MQGRGGVPSSSGSATFEAEQADRSEQQQQKKKKKKKLRRNNVHRAPSNGLRPTGTASAAATRAQEAQQAAQAAVLEAQKALTAAQDLKRQGKSRKERRRGGEDEAEATIVLKQAELDLVSARAAVAAQDKLDVPDVSLFGALREEDTVLNTDGALDDTIRMTAARQSGSTDEPPYVEIAHGESVELGRGMIGMGNYLSVHRKHVTVAYVETTTEEQRRPFDLPAFRNSKALGGKLALWAKAAKVLEQVRAHKILVQCMGKNPAYISRPGAGLPILLKVESQPGWTQLRDGDTVFLTQPSREDGSALDTAFRVERIRGGALAAAARSGAESMYGTDFSSQRMYTGREKKNVLLVKLFPQTRTWLQSGIDDLFMGDGEKTIAQQVLTITPLLLHVVFVFILAVLPLAADYSSLVWAAFLVSSYVIVKMMKVVIPNRRAHKIFRTGYVYLCFLTMVPATFMAKSESTSRDLALHSADAATIGSTFSRMNLAGHSAGLTENCICAEIYCAGCHNCVSGAGKLLAGIGVGVFIFALWMVGWVYLWYTAERYEAIEEKARLNHMPPSPLLRLKLITVAFECYNYCGFSFFPALPWKAVPVPEESPVRPEDVMLYGYLSFDAPALKFGVFFTVCGVVMFAPVALYLTRNNTEQFLIVVQIFFEVGSFPIITQLVNVFSCTGVKVGRDLGYGLEQVCQIPEGQLWGEDAQCMDAIPTVMCWSGEHFTNFLLPVMVLLAPYYVGCLHLQTITQSKMSVVALDGVSFIVAFQVKVILAVVQATLGDCYPLAMVATIELCVGMLFVVAIFRDFSSVLAMNAIRITGLAAAAGNGMFALYVLYMYRDMLAGTAPCEVFFATNTTSGANASDSQSWLAEPEMPNLDFTTFFILLFGNAVVIGGGVVWLIWMNVTHKWEPKIKYEMQERNTPPEKLMRKINESFEDNVFDPADVDYPVIQRRLLAAARVLRELKDRDKQQKLKALIAADQHCNGYIRCIVRDGMSASPRKHVVPRLDRPTGRVGYGGTVPFLLEPDSGSMRLKTLVGWVSFSEKTGTRNFVPAVEHRAVMAVSVTHNATTDAVEVRIQRIFSLADVVVTRVQAEKVWVQVETEYETTDLTGEERTRKQRTEHIHQNDSEAEMLIPTPLVLTFPRVGILHRVTLALCTGTESDPTNHGHCAVPLSLIDTDPEAGMVTDHNLNMFEDVGVPPLPEEALLQPWFRDSYDVANPMGKSVATFELEGPRTKEIEGARYTVKIKKMQSFTGRDVQQEQKLRSDGVVFRLYVSEEGRIKGRFDGQQIENATINMVLASSMHHIGHIPGDALDGMRVDLCDLSTNHEGGIRILKQLLKRHTGSLKPWMPEVLKYFLGMDSPAAKLRKIRIKFILPRQIKKYCPGFTSKTLGVEHLDMAGVSLCDSSSSSESDDEKDDDVLTPHEYLSAALHDSELKRVTLDSSGVTGDRRRQTYTLDIHSKRINLRSKNLGPRDAVVLHHWLDRVRNDNVVSRTTQLNVIGNPLGESGANLLIGLFDRDRQLQTLLGLPRKASTFDLGNMNMDSSQALVLAAELEDERGTNDLTTLILDDNGIFGSCDFEDNTQVGNGDGNIISTRRVRVPTRVPDMFADSAHKLMHALSRNTKIHTLSMRTTGIGPKVGAAFALHFVNMTSLTHVNIASNRVKNAAAELIRTYQQLPRLTTLLGIQPDTQELDFSHQDIDPGICLILATELIADRVCSQVTSVNLLGNPVGGRRTLVSDGFEALIQVFMDTPRITTLFGIKSRQKFVDFSRCNLDVAQAKMLAVEIEAGRAAAWVTRFNLMGNPIGIEGATQLATAFENRRGIETMLGLGPRNDPTLIVRVDLSNMDMDPGCLMLLAAELREARVTSDVKSIDVSNNMLFGAQQGLHGSLHDAYVHDVDSEPRGWEALCDAIKCSSVEHLRASNVGCGPVGLKTLAQSFDPELTTLDISDNYCFGYSLRKKAIGVFTVVVDVVKLLDSTADEGKTSDAWESFCCDGLGKSKCTSLNLSRCGLGPRATSSLAACLPTEMKFLDISHNFLFGAKPSSREAGATMNHSSDSQIAGWRTLWTKISNSQLTEVLTENVGMGPKGVAELVLALQSQHCCVERLCILGNELGKGAKDLIAVFESAMTVPTIQTLIGLADVGRDGHPIELADLRSRNMDNSNIKVLAAEMRLSNRAAKHVRSINVLGNPVSNEGLGYLRSLVLENARIGSIAGIPSAELTRFSWANQHLHPVDLMIISVDLQPGDSSFASSLRSCDISNNYMFDSKRVGLSERKRLKQERKQHRQHRRALRKVGRGKGSKAAAVARREARKADRASVALAAVADMPGTISRVFSEIVTSKSSAHALMDEIEGDRSLQHTYDGLQPSDRNGWRDLCAVLPDTNISDLTCTDVGMGPVGADMSTLFILAALCAFVRVVL
jgi:hypothetical protein